MTYHLVVETPGLDPNLTEEESEKRDLIERLRQTEKPTIPSVLILSLVALFYVLNRPELRVNFTLFLALAVFFNTAVILFQLFIVPGKYYGQLLSNLEAVVLSFFAVISIALTGGFASPIFFSLYLIMLSTPINEIVTPIVMATVQELFLGLVIIGSPILSQQLFSDPVKGLLLFFSPLGVAYFTISMLYETFTQKKEKEKARKLSRLLTQEKKKLEAVITGIGEMVAATNESGKIELLNGAVYEILGIKGVDLLGQDFAAVFKSVDFNLEGPETEVPIAQQGGEPLTFKVKTYPLMDEAGQRRGKIFVFRDITSEKELERMKIDFVSMAAHELRTPLTSLRGYISFLKDEVYEKLSAEQKVYLDRASISSDSLSSLVDNLLNISRIESGNLELSLKETDLVELFHPIIGQFRDKAAQKSLTLQFKFEKKLDRVMVDNFRISEVLANLLDNAISYTKSGARITVTIKQKDGEVITTVADTGLGIASANLKHLFTKFYRVSGTLAEGSKGTGLGLFICKSIVEMHQGRIWVESQLGKGTKFFFALPIRP